MQHPAATCVTRFVVHREGGVFFVVQCAKYEQIEFLWLLAFSDNTEFCISWFSC